MNFFDTINKSRQPKMLTLMQVVAIPRVAEFYRRGGVCPALIERLYEIRYWKMYVSGSVKVDFDMSNVLRISYERYYELANYESSHFLESFADELFSGYKDIEAQAIAGVVYVLLKINDNGGAGTRNALAFLNEMFVNKDKPVFNALSILVEQVKKGSVKLVPEYDIRKEEAAAEVNVRQVRKEFGEYLKSKNYKESTIKIYSSVLMDTHYSNFFQLTLGYETVYHIGDKEIAESLFKVVDYKRYGENGNLANALRQYVGWLEEKSATAKGMVVESVQAPLEVRGVVDVKKVRSVKKECEVKKEEDVQEECDVEEKQEPVEHESLVAEIFCEIAQRYLECMKNKEVRMRTEAKHCLNSIMEELKLHDRVPRDVRACINRFDDMTPPDIPQIIIKEYVLEKNVETEVQNVESGGNGVTINKK